MSVEIYLTRHGQTEFNLAGKIQGRLDSPLTAEGIAAAERLGGCLKNTVFQAAFCSTSPRARRTAELILQRAGQATLPLHENSDLCEYGFGSFEGTSVLQLHQRAAAAFGLPDHESWLQHYRNHPDCNRLMAFAAQADPKAESETALLARYRAALGQIAAQAADGGRVLVVSHGLAITSFIKSIDRNAYPYQSVPNASICRLLWQHGQWQIVSIGQTSA